MGGGFLRSDDPRLREEKQCYNLNIFCWSFKIIDTSNIPDLVSRTGTGSIQVVCRCQCGRQARFSDVECIFWD